MKRALLASSLVLVLFGCSSSSEPVSTPTLVNRQPIQGGQYDTDHVNIVGMVMLTQGGMGMCSGSLIAPNLVLTARHCVSPLVPDTGYVDCASTQFGTPNNPTNFYISTDGQLSQNGAWHQGAQVFVPPDSTSVCGYDVALVILNENLTTAPVVPRIDLEAQAGEPYTAVGYGQQGSTGWGGDRMELGGLSVQCTSGDCPNYDGTQSSEFEGDTGVCQGDSGGPALDANGRVFGVVSRGATGCTHPIYSSVAAWKDWIMQIAVQAAQQGGYPAPFWALSGSSDPNAGTGGAGGGGGGEPPLGTGGGSAGGQGQACSPTAGCPTGFLCVGDGQNGTCAAQCDTANPCGSGLSCDEKLNVCLNQANPNGNPQSSNSSSGCSVEPVGERGPVRPVPWLVGAAGIVLGLSRRRRRG